jgi:anti-sigma B factor antagonist
MTVNTYHEDTCLIISLDGDLDASSSIILDTALEDALNSGKKNILIDCFHLHYISSPGIGVFTSRLEDCEKSQVQIVLFGMSEKIFNVFKILGLHQIIPIKKTKEEAKLFVNDVQHSSFM